MTRIVKMTFKAEYIPKFHEIFESSKPKILAFGGCTEVALVQDIHHPEVMMTISQWESEEALNRYRQSEFFGQVWKQTKALFAEKPQAWSLNKIK